MQTHIEKAENGYTVRFTDEYWTEAGKPVEAGRGYKTTTETLRVYSTLDAAFAEIASFYGVIYYEK